MHCTVHCQRGLELGATYLLISSLTVIGFTVVHKFI
jgi:hypothetical protein